MKTIYYDEFNGKYYEDINCTRECPIYYSGGGSGEAGGAVLLLLVAMLIGAYYIVPIIGVILAYRYRGRIDYWARGMFLCAYAFSVVEGMLPMLLPTINPFLALSVYYWCINLLKYPKRTKKEWIIDLIVVLFPFLDPLIRGVITSPTGQAPGYVARHPVP